MKPYVFGHKGASGYEIENTSKAFDLAVKMGAGIEIDIQMTIDNKLICLHNPLIKIGLVYYYPNELTYEELRQLKFEDGRKVPLVKDVFEKKYDNIRFSFDILNRKAGLQLIKLAKKHNLIDKVEITDRRIGLLSTLKKADQFVKLIYTPIGRFSSINDRTLNINRLRENKINTLNLMCSRNFPNNFKEIVDNGLSCYVYNVNTKKSMLEVLKLNYKDQIVDAIYTDYPDKLIKLRDNLFK